MSKDAILSFDEAIISFLKRISLPLAHLSIFLIFFWFGALKVLGQSPANPLVQGLMEKTIPFMAFDQFIVIFGLYEMIIGIAFIVPHLERLAIALLVPHMIMTALPLILLPEMTWGGFFVPTMEGQYIIKNIVIVALALGLASHLKPMRKNEAQ